MLRGCERNLGVCGSCAWQRGMQYGEIGYIHILSAKLNTKNVGAKFVYWRELVIHVHGYYTMDISDQ